MPGRVRRLPQHANATSLGWNPQTRKHACQTSFTVSRAQRLHACLRLQKEKLWRFQTTQSPPPTPQPRPGFDSKASIRASAEATDSILPSSESTRSATPSSVRPVPCQIHLVMAEGARQHASKHSKASKQRALPESSQPVSLSWPARAPLVVHACCALLVSGRSSRRRAPSPPPSWMLSVHSRGIQSCDGLPEVGHTRARTYFSWPVSCASDLVLM